MGLACFAVSRSAGHILKNLLMLSGHKAVWNTIRPFSGAINTFMFVVVGAITLFFERVWVIYNLILKDRQALKSAHKELMFLNQNLENMVAERTNALSTSEFKYRQIFEVSKDVILIASQSGHILNLNPSGYNLLGLNGETAAIENRTIQEFLANNDDWRKVLALIDDEGSLSSVEIDLKAVDGSRKRGLISGSLAKDPGNDQLTVHLLIKDIEQRKIMEERLAQADKLASIGELSSGIAHEINNPLGVILGYTQLLLRDEDENSERRKDLITIEKQVRSCKSIVEDLLSFARKSETKKEAVRIDGLIDDVFKFIRQHSRSEGIQMERKFDRSIPLLMLDEKKVKQVLINLIMNAIYAIDTKGSIRVATELDRESDRIFIRIADDGCGIEKKIFKKIFDPFFTTKSTGEGTGLGLSVSYGIIKDHGGDIIVDSEPGKGSTFTIIMPMINKNAGR